MAVTTRSTSITRSDLAKILKGNVVIPLLPQRLNILRETGRILAKDFGGRFHRVLEAAEGFFPRGYPDWANDWLASLFPVWLMFDYKDSSGKTGMDRFEEALASTLTADDRKILARMRPERFRLVQVERARPGSRLKLKDLHSGEFLEVRAEAASERLSEGDTCFVRLRRLKGGSELDTLAFVPREHRDKLLLSLAARVDQVRGEEPGIDEEGMMQRRSMEVFHLALEAAFKKEPPVDIKDLPKEEQEVLQDAVKDHFERWLDTPQPGLEGRTPMEASADPRLKQELKALLDEIESRSDQKWLKAYLLDLRTRLKL